MMEQTNFNRVSILPYFIHKINKKHKAEHSLSIMLPLANFFEKQKKEQSKTI